MHSVPRQDLQAMLGQLDQAVHSHHTWHEFLTRVLICRLPFDPRLASPDAHRECAFGFWYYNNAPSRLRSHPSFCAIEAQHREMHEMASTLLRETADRGAVSADAYDHFTRRMAKFRLELETLKRELETALGNLDPLTGANNRIGMLTWLRDQQEMVRRDVLSCSLAMIDLDFFKSVNDRFGHMAGDFVLMGVARYMLEHIRPYDKLYRYGGEEFLLCMQGLGLGASYTLVDRLRWGVAAMPIPLDAGPIQCTISCGVALLEAEVAVEKVIERADRALYAAKSAGRNQTQAWDPATP
jgi:diguanylate cyclase (GGDEF)-like protein